jgi:arylsulfate sulfotransferase
VAPSYSFFGGNTAVLSNGNLEFCESAGSQEIDEVLQQQGAPQTVWKMLITGQFPYRGQRIPSLYPGVQW